MTRKILFTSCSEFKNSFAADPVTAIHFPLESTSFDVSFRFSKSAQSASPITPRAAGVDRCHCGDGGALFHRLGNRRYRRQNVQQNSGACSHATGGTNPLVFTVTSCLVRRNGHDPRCPYGKTRGLGPSAARRRKTDIQPSAISLRHRDSFDLETEASGLS